MVQKVLLTGAAGFIGSSVAKVLISRGYQVVGVDSLNDYYSEQLKKLRLDELFKLRRFQFIKMDLSSLEQVNGLFEEHSFYGVIHLAAQAGVRLPMSESHKYVSSNLVGFHNILTNTLKKEIKNFVYASSSSVYGDDSPLPYSEKSKILSPKSFYGLTKLNNEIESRLIGSSYSTSSRGLRYFTVYGPWGRPDMAYFRLMGAALGQNEFTLFGDGSIERDFTFIDDVAVITVELFENLQESTSKITDVVNIGGQRPLSMNYLIEMVSKISDSPISYQSAEEKRTDARITIADNAYLKSLLGEIEFTPLEKGLESFYDWMKHPYILEKVAVWIKSSS